MTYERLEAEERKPKRVSDHSEAWRRLPLLADTNGNVEARVRTFCADKRISYESLIALGTRVVVEPNGGGVALAWGHPAQLDGKEIISALKFRPLGDKKRYAANPSSYLEPLVIGKRASLDWFVAEGETDACRLYDLVGDVAAVMPLPAGALTFKPQWASMIPRGATVHLCHDADDAGDRGADVARRVIGGRCVRVRPPGVKDWCEWDGDRDDFIALVQNARATTTELAALDLAVLLAGPVPETPWLWYGWLAHGELALVVADPKVGKSLLALGLGAAVRRCQPYLGENCDCGIVGILDFENPLPEVHKRVRAFGITADDNAGMAYFHMPTLDLASAEAEQAIRELIDRHQLDLLVIDSVRRAAPGLDENNSQSVSSVFTPLRRVSAATGCTIVCVHHARKRIGDNPTEAGQMVRGSGDLVASVDALLYLRAKEPGTFTLETVSRRGLPHEPILVRIESDDDEGEIRLVNEGPVAMAEDKVEAMLAKVISALNADGGTLERPIIAMRVNADVKSGTFNRALKLGFQRGQLSKSERAVGKPVLYSLAPGVYQ